MKFKKGDLLAVALVLAAAVGVGLFVAGKAQSAGAPVAVVLLRGEEIRRLHLQGLAAPLTFAVDGAYHSEITAEYGRIRVSASDCPGGDCVNSGWARSAGRSLVCLPNRLEIRIEGGDAEVDGVAR